MSKRRIFKGISGNIVVQIVSVGFQLLGVPVLLKFWGISYYGEWIILVTIPSYIGISDMGLGTSTTSELSMLMEAGKAVESKEILRNVFWFILFVGSIPFLLMLMSLFIVPWYDILGLKVIAKPEFSLTFILLILYIYLNLFLTLPLGYYRVVKVYHKERYISATFRAIEFSLMLLFVILGYGVVTIALIYLITKIINLFFVLYDLHSKYNEFRLFPIGYKFSKIKHLLKPAISTLVIYIGQNLMIQGVTTLIGIKLGSLQVVIFNTTRTLTNFAKQLVNIINLTYISEFSFAYGKGDQKSLWRHFMNAQKINILISVSTLLFLALFGQLILSTWTTGKVSVIEPFFILLLIGVFLSNIWNLGLSLLVAINKQMNIGLIFILMAVLSLTIIYRFIDRFELTVVALSIIIFELGMLIATYRYCFMALNISGRRLLNWVSLKVK